MHQDGYPNLGWLFEYHAVVMRRRDADHGHRDFVECQCLPDRILIDAEMAAPEFVADERYGLSTLGLVFFRQKRPAARHGDPEHVKIVAGYVLAWNTLDTSVRLQLQMRSGKGNQTREHMILVSIVRESRIGKWVADKMGR